MKRSILMVTTAGVLLGLAGGSVAAATPQAGNRTHRYDLYTLDNSLGGTYAQGTSIDEKNEIGGFGTLPGDTVMHALLWRAKLKSRDLGTLGGPNSAIAWPNKNERGVYAGISETADDNPLGETWSCAAAVFYLAPPTKKICLGFRWQNGAMQPLSPLPGGYNSFATGINNAGDIVGWAEDGVREATCNSPQVLQFEAVVWEPSGAMRQLPPAKGDLDGAATAINDNGQVVGISGICANAIGGASAVHMLLWDKRSVVDLGNLGGQYWNTPMDISDLGHVTGFSDLPGDSADSPNFNAFFWSPGKGLQNLHTLAGDSLSEGLGINDKDQIVGVSYPSAHAFIWQKGTMTDINTLVSPKSNLTLIAAQEINDSGVITGQAQDRSTGAYVGFVAVPNWR
jgi:probable HAF family extracellular repeat protein